MNTLSTYTSLILSLFLLSNLSGQNLEYSGYVNYFNDASIVHVKANGDIILSGTYNDPNNFTAYGGFLVLDSLGILIYEGDISSIGQFGTIVNILEAPDSSIYLQTSGFDCDVGSPITMIKYDQYWNEIWQNWDWELPSFTGNAHFLSDGSFLGLGYYEGSQIHYYSASDELIWSNTYDYAFYDLCPRSDGNFLLASNEGLLLLLPDGTILSNLLVNHIYTRIFALPNGHYLAQLSEEEVVLINDQIIPIDTLTFEEEINEIKIEEEGIVFSLGFFGSILFQRYNFNLELLNEIQFPSTSDYIAIGFDTRGNELLIGGEEDYDDNESIFVKSYLWDGTTSDSQKDIGVTGILVEGEETFEFIDWDNNSFDHYKTGFETVKVMVENYGNTNINSVVMNASFPVAVEHFFCPLPQTFQWEFSGINLEPGATTVLELGTLEVLTMNPMPNFKLCFFSSVPDNKWDENHSNDNYCGTFLINSDNEIVKDSLQIYPNPANRFLNLEMPDAIREAGNLTIYNALGQKVLEEKVDAGLSNFQLNINDLNAGLYSLVLSTSDNNTLVKQFVKVKDF